MWWVQYLRRKPSAEEALQKLTESLATALGDHLKSVVIFGSYASGEFQTQHSNLNLMVILDDVCYETLQAMHPALACWQKWGHPLPILMQSDELEIYARRFPIEFLDIQDHHRIISGENVIPTIQVSREFLKAQCEHDLAAKQLHLRQILALEGRCPEDTMTLLRQSSSSILTLLRAVLRLQGAIPKMSKLEAALLLTRQLGLDGSVLERISHVKWRRSADNIPDIAANYLDLIEKVLQHLYGPTKQG